MRFEAKHLRSFSCDDMLVAGRQAASGDAEDEVEAEEQSMGAIASWPHNAGQGHHIRVAVRCRPLHPQESQAGARAIIKVADAKVVVLEDPQTTAADDYLRINKSKERRYIFDEAFHESACTRQVYERTSRLLIGGVLQGFNATVFAYGATGAGKTHTMLGNLSEPGIMMLTLLDLFNEVANQKEDRHFEVKCSFLEVYNENIRDLLRPDADYLDIREDPVKGMCVAGISEVGGLESAQEIMTLLHQANKHRSTEATGANVVSSRSHAVLQVVVEQRDRTAGLVAQVNLGKLSMIDLAGSERASHTNNKGMRMIEGANINRSLLALGNCITALSSAVAFVPYRDSKMTRLLKDSLGGNCRTAMIANISPNHLNYEDTHNTLKYAKRASNIKTKAVRNVVRVNCHVSKYTEIIKELRGEISALKSKLAEAPAGMPLAPGEEDQGDESRPDSADAEASPVSPGVAMGSENAAKWKQELIQNVEERVRIKRRLIDLAQEAQALQVQKSQAQVGISQWESSKVAGEQPEQSPPPHVRALQGKLRSLKTDVARAEETTHDLEEMLVENQQKSERLQAEMPRRVQNKDMRAFLGLVSRIYVMQVENMDMEEMNDVMAPLIQQKDLEADALRLQIRLRDRMIQDQDQLLFNEGVGAVPKPEGWVEIPGKPAKRLPSPPHSRDEERDTPRRWGARGGRAASQPPETGGGIVLPPLSPHMGRGRSSGSRAVPGGLLPPREPQAAGGAAVAAVGTEHAEVPRPVDIAGRGLGRAGLRPEALTMADVLIPPSAPPSTREVPRPLDVAGRGLGQALPRPEASEGPGPPPRTPPWQRERDSRPPPTAPPPLSGGPSGGGEPWQKGDPDATGVPSVEGFSAMPLDRRRSASVNSTLDTCGAGPPQGLLRPLGSAAAGQRRSRKKNRRALGLKERDDASQGSESELVTLPGREELAAPAPVAAVPRAAAAERKGIIEKLNRKMKPGYSPLAVPKNLH